MPHINLLPWREKQRQAQKQQFLLILLLVVAGTLGVAWLIGKGMDQLIQHQQSRNQFLTQNISTLDDKIGRIQDIKAQKQQVQQRMALIEQLQASRNIAPRVLNEIATRLPPGVAFQRFTRVDNNLSVTGVSESNNRLSEFMRQLDMSPLFINEDLDAIVANTETSDAVSEFELTFALSPTIAPPEPQPTEEASE